MRLANLPFTRSKRKNGKADKPTTVEPPMTLRNQDEAQHRNPPSWQERSETVFEFLRRAPVSELETANLGPWLWVRCPNHRSNPKQHIGKSDEESFQKIGHELIESYDVQQAQAKAANQGQPRGTIRTIMRPYRALLEEDIIALAVKMGVTFGKWMLFPNKSDLPRYWRAIAEATSEGRLGPACKVATPNPLGGKEGTLICVYTYDFTDEADVRRVLNVLVGLELGFCRADSRPIYYKCDAYTYLEIESGNRFDIRASLWSSDEVLGKNGKTMARGPVARLKEKTEKTEKTEKIGKVDSFVADDPNE